MLTLSNVKMLVTGTVLPKEEHLQNPKKKKRVNMNLYFLKNVKCEIMVFA